MAIASAQQKGIYSVPKGFDFRSPSLEIIQNKLAAVRKHSILDLGQPLGRNIEFFSHVSCTLYVENLFESLIDLPPPQEGEGEHPYENRVARALSHAPDTRFDVVFGWDLFNYMHGDLINSLMKRLSGSCRSGTLFFLMISNTLAIPDRPARMTVSADGRVSYEPVSGGERQNPRYSPLALERMMPGFRLQHSFLLGTAMQDYLFSFG